MESLVKITNTIKMFQLFIPYLVTRRLMKRKAKPDQEADATEVKSLKAAAPISMFLLIMLTKVKLNRFLKKI